MSASAAAAPRRNGEGKFLFFFSIGKRKKIVRLLGLSVFFKLKTFFRMQKCGETAR